MSGWYRMERGWQDHPVFSDEPYTDREAFEWLISNACWKPQLINIKGNPVELKAGQLSHSVRFLADKWQWKKDKVNRYLKKLVKFNMIATDNATGQNIITICNYTKYQGERDRSATENDTEARQERDKDKEINNIINTAADDTRDEFSEKLTSKSKSKFEHVEVGKRVLEAMGISHDDPSWFGSYAIVEMWMNGGMCPDRDILPTVKSVMARRGQAPPPKNLNYFTQAIADTHAARNKPLPRGNAHEGFSHRSKGSHTPSVAERADQATSRALAKFGFEGESARDCEDSTPVVQHENPLRLHSGGFGGAGNELHNRPVGVQHERDCEGIHSLEEGREGLARECRYSPIDL